MPKAEHSSGELPRLHFNFDSPATPHFPPAPKMKIKMEEDDAMDTSDAFDNRAEVEVNDAMDTSDAFDHSTEMAVKHEQLELQPPNRNAAPPPAHTNPPLHQDRAGLWILSQMNWNLWQLRRSSMIRTSAF